jgi:hypothetical protein
VVGFIAGKRISVVVFPPVCGFGVANLREQLVFTKFLFSNLGKPLQNRTKYRISL